MFTRSTLDVVYKSPLLFNNDTMKLNLDHVKCEMSSKII